MMPEWIEPQFPLLVDKAPAGDEWLHEVKFDGYRMQLGVQNRATQVRTRRGYDWTHKFPALIKTASKLGDCIMDGGLCALDDKGNSDFPVLISALEGDKATI